MLLAFKRIVCATDFSPASELPIEYARSLAVRFGAQVHVLHVLEEPLPMGGEVYLAESSEFRERRRQDAQQRLAEITRMMPGVNVTCETVFGNPAREIVQVAKDRHADLIVMGTHGRGMVAHLLLGSVAERVVRTAPCALMTVRTGTSAPTGEPQRAETAGA